MRRILAPIVAVILLAILLSPSRSVPNPPTLEFGPDWSRSCQDGTCTLTLFSYPAFLDGNPISESFFFCSASFCASTLFQTEITPNGLVTLTRDSSEASFQLLTINGQPPSWPVPSVTDNVLSFPLSDALTLTYTSLPDMLKEELLLASNPGADLSLSFSLSGQGFTLLPPIAYDANLDPLPMDVEGNQSTLSLTISEAVLSGASYPVTIDPTLTLNDSNISWNGYVSNSTAILQPFSRTSNPTGTLRIGRSKTALNQVFRSAIYFNTSALPANATITQALLDVTVVQLDADDSNLVVGVHPLELLNDSYPSTPEDCGGHCLFFKDMGNGSLYNQTTLPQSGRFTWNLTAAQSDILATVNRSWFAFGFVSANESDDGSPRNDSRLRPRDFSTPSQRPVLTISYLLPASEAEARTAIEQGMNNSLGSPPKRADQKIYIVTSQGQHALATVDKLTSSGNQTWAFNYLTSLDAAAGLVSLPRAFHFWENSSLTFPAIVSQVESFINATRWPA